MSKKNEMVKVFDVGYGLALEIEPMVSGALAMPLHYDAVNRVWLVRLSYKEARALARQLHKTAVNKK